jgi:integrase/recombinase XerD
MSVVPFPKSSKTGDLVDKFLDDLANTGKSPNTIAGYTSDLKHFRVWSKVPLLEINANHLREYFKSIASLSQTTRARKQATLKSFYLWCLKHDLISVNPMDKMDTVKLPQKLPRPLETKVVDKILSAIPKECLRDRLLFTLMLETGIRITEALNIRKEDLSLIPDGETILIRNGKGGKDRVVMLYAAPDCLKLLEKYLKQSDITSGALFRGSKSKGGSSKPMTYQAVNHLWDKYCKKAGISASMHQLRHTFATTLLNEGINVTVVRKLMGHKNLQTTMRYADVTDEFVREELLKKHKRSC